MPELCWYLRKWWRLPMKQGTNVAVILFGIFLCVFGIASIVAAVSDFRSWISHMYENNKNRKTGLAVFASSPNGYRRNIALSGIFALILGVIFIAAS